MTRLHSFGMTAVCAAVMLAGASRASAESVSLAFDKSVNPAVSLSGSSSGPYTPTGPFFWHDSGIPSNGSFPTPTVTFCIEVNGALPSVGSSAVFGVQSLSADLGSAKADAITELYGRFYNTAWESSSFNGSNDSISFQLALWELATDTGKNLSSGSFTASSSLGGIVTTAQNWLNSLTGDTSSFSSKFGNQELIALVAPDPNGPKPQDYQDQITLRNKPAGVPAPPGVILAGVGLLGLVGRARWSRSA
jgi:hypothetical protein